MSNDSEILFIDDEFQLFAEEDSNPVKIIDAKWKLMIVDDEQEVHSVTKMVLSKFVYEGKSLDFYSAYSASEAKKVILENPDTALILLDVVMEDDNAGLQFVKYIRDVLKNKLIRIILRTGQAGQAPEEKIVIDYDINDYKEKTELTSQKFFSSVVSALRSYRDLSALETSRKGLRKIIDSFSNIFQMQTIYDFSSSVLSQLTSILNLNDTILHYKPSSFAAVKVDNQFYIIAATGDYLKDINKKILDVLPDNVIKNLNNAYKSKKNIYQVNSLIIYLQSKTGYESLIYFQGCKDLCNVEQDLIEVFCSNISAVNESIISTSHYESEKHQRLLSDALRDFNTDLTSTLDLKEVLDRLIKGLSKVLTYDNALAVLKKNETFDVFAKTGEDCVNDTNLILDSILNEIICKVSKTGLPILITDRRSDTQMQTWSFSSSDILSFLGVPIIYDENLLGVIVLQSFTPNTYGENDKNIALTFAGQAGIAIENARLYSELVKRNSAINNLLDNAGQGFLTFGDDLLIDEEYSQECLRIFGEKIEQKKLSELVYSDEEQKKLLDFMLVKVLYEKSEIKLGLYLPLLPDNAIINEKYIRIEYKIIDSIKRDGSKTFLAIITDNTEKKQLENKMEEERKILKMVVKAVTNYNSFTKCFKDYQKFCSTGINEILESGHTLDEISFEIYRSIHTFKGNFGQIEMVNIVEKLHDFENNISDIRKKVNTMSLCDLKSFIRGFSMAKWIDKDLSILKKVLGENFFNQEKAIFIDQAKLIEIEQKMLTILSPVQCNIILPELRRLRFKPIKELLNPYRDYMEKLSERLDKPLNPLNLECEDILVDLDKYSDFARSLVHVFRNAVDHGIEPVYKRMECGKNEHGTITCKTYLKDNNITISIFDDGSGLDFDKIKKIAVQKGITVSNLTTQDLLYLIFSDEFSTKELVNGISGRGIGLAAVKGEVEKIAGKIEVKTEPNKGTEFLFKLPYMD